MKPRILLILTTTVIVMIFGAAEFSMARVIGVLLADDKGKTLYAKNADMLFIPASITKIMTSLAALETLGPDHRFETLVGYDYKTADLYIKGFGDPLFISEQIRRMLRELIQKIGSGPIRNIVLDHGFFHPNLIIPGTGESNNPYDATTGALCANFNTIFFKWDKNTNRFVSAEPQTPLPDFFQTELKTSGLSKERVVLSRQNRRQYPGLLVKAFLAEKGIVVKGKIKEGAFPGQLPVKVNFKSGFTLADDIQKLLRFSNNFMANQIMLTMGAIQYGEPATLEKGITCLRSFVMSKLDIKGFTLVEGSGLSRQNRFSPRQMLEILKAFMPYRHLMKKKGNEFYKTGTLSDVRTRAGYFRGKNNRLYPFVIMVNHTDRGYADIRKMLKNKVAQVSGTP